MLRVFTMFCHRRRLKCHRGKSNVVYLAAMPSNSIQFFIKDCFAGSIKIASSLACCNYLAKATKTSQKLRTVIGNIPVGVITRWNSYLLSAVAVYNARTNINEYVNSVRCASDMASMVKPRVAYLNNGGFCFLHNVSVSLQTLVDLTIDEEGEISVTSSTVVPRLIAARENMTSNSVKGYRNEARIIDPTSVATRKVQMHELWDTYQSSFLNDELFI